VESYPYPVKEGQRYTNLNPGSHPKGKGIEKLIQIITPAPTTGKDNHHTARLN